MYLSVIKNRFDRVVQASFVKLLSIRGYERKDNQFYLKSGRVGKLITIRRDHEHPYYRQVAIFTIHVEIFSDDFWEMSYPGEAIPILPSQDHRYSTFHRTLGQFYSKLGGDRWLALDATVPEQTMSIYLCDLLQFRILPYLDRFDSVEDILAEFTTPSKNRMRMLAWLGRREEAHTELRKLIEIRHQKGYRIGLVESAKKIGIIK